MCREQALESARVNPRCFLIVVSVVISSGLYGLRQTCGQREYELGLSQWFGLSFHVVGVLYSTTSLRRALGYLGGEGKQIIDCYYIEYRRKV